MASKLMIKPQKSVIMRQLNLTEIIAVFTRSLIELMIPDNKTVSKKLELNHETFPSTQVTI